MTAKEQSLQRRRTVIFVFEFLLEARKRQSKRFGPVLKHLEQNEYGLFSNVRARTVHHAVKIRQELLRQLGIADVGKTVQSAADLVLRALG